MTVATLVGLFAFVVKFSTMKQKHAPWPLWQHFMLTVILAFTFVVFYSIALAWNTYRRPVETGSPPGRPAPFELVLTPPASPSLFPIPMEK